MTTRIAINGLGRIGRSALKQVLETPELELAAVNDLVPPDNLAYLLQYDTVYGRYRQEVSHDEKYLIIGDTKVPVFNQKDPADLPWDEYNVDTVLECTGVFRQREDLEKHLQAGAKHVILSAPGKGDEIVTIVHGVNQPQNGVNQIISCASCTTNCIAPVMEVLGRRIGVKKALMTTIHAYTTSQGIVDGPNRKFRRGRAGAANLVPTTTGAAVATSKALPHLKGLFDGVAVRAPVPIGSIADITLVTEKKTTVEEINNIFREEAGSDRYKNVLDVVEDPIVSSDIIQNSHASIVDLSMTQVVDGDLIKVMSWYDNEWGYASQMIREAVRMGQDVTKADPTAERDTSRYVEASFG